MRAGPLPNVDRKPVRLFNLAARVSGQAAGGGVLLTAQTAGLARCRIGSPCTQAAKRRSCRSARSTRARVGCGRRGACRRRERLALTGGMGARPRGRCLCARGVLPGPAKAQRAGARPSFAATRAPGHVGSDGALLPDRSAGSSRPSVSRVRRELPPALGRPWAFGSNGVCDAAEVVAAWDRWNPMRRRRILLCTNAPEIYGHSV